MNRLKMINLENNKFTNTICMNISDCFSSIQCNIILPGASVCTPLSTTFRLSTPSPVGTASPTLSILSPITLPPTLAIPVMLYGVSSCVLSCMRDCLSCDLI